MAKFSKSIGIVGGAGPMASAFLYTSILRVCQQENQANDYADFPEILVVSFPFTRGDRKRIGMEIALCFSRLSKAGASLICIASHSFHGFLPALPKRGFVSLVAESLRETRRLKISRALVLASETTIHLGLYERSGMDCVYPPPADQLRVNQYIREVAGGKINASQSKGLEKMISRLRKTLQFDGVLIACTELPLINAQRPLKLKSVPIVDTIQVLARVLVERASQKKKSRL